MNRLSLILCTCAALSTSNSFALTVDQNETPLPVIEMSEDMRKVEGITNTPQVIATPYGYSSTAPNRVRIYCGLEANLPSTREISFSSTRQMTEFVKNLFDLYSSHQVDKILKICSNSFVMPQLVSAQEIEQFWFQNIEMQVLSLREMHNQSPDKSQSGEYLITLIENFRKYFRLFAPNTIPTHEFEAHLYCLDFFSMNIYGNDLAAIHAPQDAFIKYIKAAIMFGESSLDRMKQLRALQNEIKCDNLEKTINSNETKFKTTYTKNTLLVENILLYKTLWNTNSTHENKKLLSKIQSIYKSLVDSNQLNTDNTEILRMIQNWTRMKEAERIPGRKGKEEYLKIRKNALNHAAIHTKNRRTEFVTEGDRLFTSIHLWLSKNKKNKTALENLSTEIITFENRLFEMSRKDENQIVKSTEISLTEKLTHAYKAYKSIDHAKCLHEVFVEHPLIFLQTGDVEGALARIAAFKLVCNEIGEEFSILTRYLSAFASCIQGNFDELIVLENEEKKKTASKQKSKKTRNEIVTEIHDHLTTSANETAQEKAHKDQAETLREQKMTKKKQQRNNAAQAASHLIDDASIMQASAEQEKLERLARHEAAQAERQAKTDIEAERDQDGKMSATELEAYQSAETAPAQTILPESAQDATVQSLFQLKGKKALKVEDAIVTNTWKFERDDLIAYYIAMGCETRDGKGSHTIVKLPNSVSFYKDGELITVLSDFGGALTLPQWKDYVPHYLRAQILLARDKLMNAKPVRPSVG